MDTHYLMQLLHNHGSIGLFILLALGIFGLPIPDETLLVIAGSLAAKQVLFLPNIIFASIFGAMIGITASYVLGRTVGHSAMVKFGKHIGITEKKMDKAHEWYEKIGKWTLTIGYFIPGVRHFSGLIAGSTSLSYRQFAIFAYTGAIIWACVFIALGYFAYPHVAGYFG